MGQQIGHLAIIGQGLIGSSITRAVFERRLARDVTITDFDPKVRRRLLELGLGHARVVDTNAEAVKDADLVIVCVPVGAFAAIAQMIIPHMKPGAILSDVGSVKSDAVDAILPLLPETIHFIPAHPLAGTEFSGPDAGLPKLFVNRWCIVTPPPKHDAAALETVRQFWVDLGSQVEIMEPRRHDYALAITSHLPHLVAFSIFHTALAQEQKTGTPIIQFSAGAFRDFTRIASSNPVMWRDIFLKNKEPILEMFKNLIADMQSVAKAIENDDGATLEAMLSKSRTTRRKVIEREHISLRPDSPDKDRADTIIRPYASDD
jgi:cyclohexadieny/prephenate dehydrogenase